FLGYHLDPIVIQHFFLLYQNTTIILVLQRHKQYFLFYKDTTFFLVLLRHKQHFFLFYKYTTLLVFQKFE
ncbi:unnamed protein product, partial [Arabidopsis halleri]